MDTNKMNKRIFTIACRGGIAIQTDSKLKANGKGGLKKFISTTNDSQMACMDALLELLNRIPQGVTLDHSVAILLPSNIAFLAFENTRTQWLSTGKKKSGAIIDKALLEKVGQLDTLIKAHGSNIQMFNQTKITSKIYKMYRTETWKAMAKIVPMNKEYKKVNSMGF